MALNFKYQRGTIISKGHHHLKAAPSSQRGTIITIKSYVGTCDMLFRPAWRSTQTWSRRSHAKIHRWKASCGGQDVNVNCYLGAFLTQELQEHFKLPTLYVPWSLMTLHPIKRMNISDGPLAAEWFAPPDLWLQSSFHNIVQDPVQWSNINIHCCFFQGRVPHRIDVLCRPNWP